ncbi:MAG TPA: trigger factor [Gammaproteobacteria bacterium]|nr:trigger factor [Gammaproteobacteria bacterium]
MNTATSNLDVSVENPGGLQRRLTIRVPQADIEREVDARLKKVGRTARLKGFRPGKIPPRVVRQRYGGQVRQEVLSDVIRSSFSRAIQQERLNPAGGPEIEPIEAAEGGQEFAYRATFEVFPEIEIRPLADLSIERPVVEITEADIDNMIEKLREQRAEWRSVERKADEGDRVVVDFVGTIDGEPFEGGKGEEVPIVVGAGQVIEDLDKGLKGLAAGDSKTVKVKFPKDYPSEALAGKKAEFQVETRRVEEKVLPAVDAEFAKLFGVEEGGLEALRVEVRKNMQRELDERLKTSAKTRAFDALLAANEIPLPRALVNDEIRRLAMDTARRLGIEDPQQLPSVERFEPAARRRVAIGLLLQELIRKNGIELDRARVQRRVDELAAPYEKPQEAAQIYRSSRELMAQVESGVLEDQVVEFVLGQAGTVEKPMTFDEFMEP